MLQATGFAGSTWLCAPHRAEAFPAAVRELLEHHQHGATNLLRLATRRFDIRSSELAPLDGPAIQNRQVLGFRNVAQHLETLLSRLAFVARSVALAFRRKASSRIAHALPTLSRRLTQYR